MPRDVWIAYYTMRRCSHLENNIEPCFESYFQDLLLREHDNLTQVGDQVKKEEGKKKKKTNTQTLESISTVIRELILHNSFIID